MFYDFGIKELCATILLALVMFSCSSEPVAAATMTPLEVCKSVADNWDAKSPTYSVDEVVSAREHGSIYYCNVTAEQHRVDYSIPVSLKITYNDETEGYSVKRWGY